MRAFLFVGAVFRGFLGLGGIILVLLLDPRSLFFLVFAVHNPFPFVTDRLTRSFIPVGNGYASFPGIGHSNLPTSSLPFCSKP